MINRMHVMNFTQLNLYCFMGFAMTIVKVCQVVPSDNNTHSRDEALEY